MLPKAPERACRSLCVQLDQQSKRLEVHHACVGGPTILGAVRTEESSGYGFHATILHLMDSKHEDIEGDVLTSILA